MSPPFERTHVPNCRVHACEDCGEPATRLTSDGVWLCEGDYQSLCDRYFADNYVEGVSSLYDEHRADGPLKE